MTPLQKFLTNFESMMKERPTKPFMVRISASLAQDEELRKTIGIANDRADYMGVIINVVPDFQVLETYEDAFPQS